MPYRYDVGVEIEFRSENAPHRWGWDRQFSGMSTVGFLRTLESRISHKINVPLVLGNTWSLVTVAFILIFHTSMCLEVFHKPLNAPIRMSITRVNIVILTVSAAYLHVGFCLKPQSHDFHFLFHCEHHSWCRVLLTTCQKWYPTTTITCNREGYSMRNNRISGCSNCPIFF